jgi:hypothetical protein
MSAFPPCAACFCSGATRGLSITPCLVVARSLGRSRRCRSDAERYAYLVELVDGAAVPGIFNARLVPLSVRPSAGPLALSRSLLVCVCMVLSVEERVLHRAYAHTRVYSYAASDTSSSAAFCACWPASTQPKPKTQLPRFLQIPRRQRRRRRGRRQAQEQQQQQRQE